MFTGEADDEWALRVGGMWRGLIVCCAVPAASPSRLKATPLSRRTLPLQYRQGLVSLPPCTSSSTAWRTRPQRTCWARELTTLFLAGKTDGRIAPRSGLAVKHGITTGAGVIDADYTGHVKVLLFNLGEKEYAVGEGERIAQLVLELVSRNSRGKSDTIVRCIC